MRHFKTHRSYWLPLLLPLALVLYFHAVNIPNPRNDAALFWRDSYNLYFALKSEGLSAFRNFPINFHKPLLLGVTGAVALSLTGGSIKAAVLIHNAALKFVFLTYLFLLFRMFLSPRQAGAAAAYIGSLAWILSLFYKFEAEVLFLPALLAAFYHLLRSESFSNVRHISGFAIWLGIAALARPIEAVFFLGPPLLLFLGEGIFRKKLDKRGLVILSLTGIGIFGWFYSTSYALLRWVMPALSKSQPTGPFTLQEDQFWPAVFGTMLGIPAIPVALASLALAIICFPRLKQEVRGKSLRVGQFAWLWLVAGPIAVLSLLGRVYSVHYFYFSFVLLFVLLLVFILSRQGRIAQSICLLTVVSGLVLNLLITAQCSFKVVSLFKLRPQGYEVVSRSEGEALRVARAAVAIVAAMRSGPSSRIGVVHFRGFDEDGAEIDSDFMLEVASFSQQLPIAIQAVYEFVPEEPDASLGPKGLRCMPFWLVGPREENNEYSVFKDQAVRRLGRLATHERLEDLYLRHLGAVGKYDLFATTSRLPKDFCSASYGP